MQPYQIAPSLTGDDFDRLKVSIAERGVEVAVVVDEHGNIIDGHHRAMIADSLGIEYPKDVRTGLAEHEKRLLAAELNLARRQLTVAQKVIMGKKIEPDIAERSKRRQGMRTDLQPSGNFSGRFTETRDEVARAVGLGTGRTYDNAKKVIEAVEESAPDLMMGLAQGEISLPEARKEVVRRGREQSLADPSLPQMREPSREERAYDRLIDMTIISQMDPEAVAAAAWAHRADTTRLLIGNLGELQAWTETFIAALKRGERAPLRVVS